MEEKFGYILQMWCEGNFLLLTVGSKVDKKKDFLYGEINGHISDVKIDFRGEAP